MTNAILGLNMMGDTIGADSNFPWPSHGIETVWVFGLNPDQFSRLPRGTTYGYGNLIGAPSGIYWEPRQIHTDQEGYIYYWDIFASWDILKLPPYGYYPEVVATADQFFGYGDHIADRDIALDPWGNVYVTDGGRIRRVMAGSGYVYTFAGSDRDPADIDPENIETIPWGHIDGVGTQAKFGHIHSICCDRWGSVFVSDYSNDCVRKIGIGGMVSTLADVDRPTGIDVDAMGNVYVFSNQTIDPPGLADGAIIKINRVGMKTTLTSGNLHAGEIACAPGGVVFFSDQYGDGFVGRCNAEGETTTITDTWASIGGISTQQFPMMIKPANDDFADAFDLVPDPETTIHAWNFYATTETNEADEWPSVWWKFTGEDGKVALIDGSTSDMAAVIEVYTGTALDNLVSVIAGGDTVEFETTDQLYYVRFTGDGGTQGIINFVFTLTEPAVVPNDNFADAIAMTFGEVYNGSNVDATSEEGEVNTFPSVWWKFTVTQEGGFIVATTTGSEIDTVMYIYTGTALDNLVQVGYNDDESNWILTSKITMDVTSQTYYVRIQGYDGEEGNITIQVDFTLY